MSVQVVIKAVYSLPSGDTGTDVEYVVTETGERILHIFSFPPSMKENERNEAIAAIKATFEEAIEIERTLKQLIGEEVTV